MKDWLESLDYCAVSRGKKGLTLGAKRQRLSTMKNFVNFSKMNPDQLLDEAKRDINLSGKRLLDFFSAGVEDGKSRNTMATQLSFLRGFYSHNDLTFPKRWRIPSRTKSQVKHKDEQKPMFKRNGNGEVELKAETLQKFIQTLNFRDQTITLCLLSSGTDANDILALNFDFVKNVDDETDRLLLSGNRIKDNIEFRVFLSQEATQFVKRYVRQVKAEQRLEITDKTPLFFMTDSSHGNRGKRMTVQALASNFRDGAKKIGNIKEGELNSLRPKRFRHLFKNACSHANIDEGWVNSMIGHKSNVSQSYLEKSVLMLEAQYEKIEKFVTVFGIGKIRFDESNRVIRKLEAKMTIMEKGSMLIVDETNQLKIKVQELEKQLKSTEGYLKAFEEIIDKGELAKFREWMETQYNIEAQENLYKDNAEITKKILVAKKSP